jgi:hypothetical protein
VLCEERPAPTESGLAGCAMTGLKMACGFLLCPAYLLIGTSLLKKICNIINIYNFLETRKHDTTEEQRGMLYGSVLL